MLLYYLQYRRLISTTMQALFMRNAFLSAFLGTILASKTSLAQNAEATILFRDKPKEKLLLFPHQLITSATPDTLCISGKYLPMLYFDDCSLGVLIDTTINSPAKNMTQPVSLRNRTGSDNYYLLRYFDFQQRRVESGNWRMAPPTYYLNYGHKYLQRFREETRETLSRKGQQWLDRTLVNLQTAIEDVLARNPAAELNDTAFNDLVYATHATAYEKAGFVQLNVLDKVKIALTPDLSDLLDPRGRALVRQMRKKQFAYYRSHPLFAMRQALQLAAGMGEIMVRVTRYAAKHGVERTKVWSVVREVVGL